MKTLVVVSAFALLLVSCSNMENLQEPIENLTTDWGNTTTSVTGFVNSLQSTHRELQHQFAEMTVPEGLTLSEEAENQIAELQDGYQEELHSLTELSGEVSSFIGDWQSKAEQLTELRTGLVAGSLDAEAGATVENLQTIVNDGKKGLDKWQGELEDIRENTGEMVDRFREVIANSQGN
jgi:hypothetical protein